MWLRHRREQALLFRDFELSGIWVWSSKFLSAYLQSRQGCRPADALDAVRSEIPHALAPVHARSAKSLSTLLLSFDGERVTFIATPEENSESLHFTRSDWGIPTSLLSSREVEIRESHGEGRNFECGPIQVAGLGTLRSKLSARVRVAFWDFFAFWKIEWSADVDNVLSR